MGETLVTGKIVGGDLYHLWRVSEVHLPRIADVYYDSTRIIGGAKTGDGGGFRANTSAYPGSSAMTSSVGAAWAELRDELQRMYAQVGGAVLAAAEGVRQATQAYVAADMASANALQQFLADPNNHDPNSEASNPPKPGADDHPGEPVLP
jgi:hypothetical protein